MMWFVEGLLAWCILCVSMVGLFLIAVTIWEWLHKDEDER